MIRLTAKSFGYVNSCHGENEYDTKQERYLGQDLQVFRHRFSEPDTGHFRNSPANRPINLSETTTLPIMYISTA